VGLGSTFYAVIPLNYSGARELTYAPEITRDLDATKLPVVVVENNSEALFIYEKYLKSSLFQAIPARNLKEARIALRQIRPVAVILDVLLDGEDSWELLRELKTDPATSDLPVFVVTVSDHRRKAAALGADGFHSKPIDRAWLLEQLDLAARGRARNRVLVVDDDEASRYLVKTLLADTGSNLLEASSGNEGMRLAKEAQPDMIVLDLSMPDISGFDVLEKLKNDSTTAQIPVIIYTSRDLSKEEREMVSPAVGVVTKHGHSREVARASFAEAFARAGVPFEREKRAAKNGEAQ
jgi:CheY-like chemotaxis protein